jgi:hypothetical protein
MNGTADAKLVTSQPENTPPTSATAAAAPPASSASALDSKDKAPKTSDRPVNSGTQKNSDEAGSSIEAASAGTSLASAAAEAQQSAEAKRRAEAQLRLRQISEIVARAKDRESQGNYEDALKDYEQASRLDPSNTALKHNIRRLRDQIAKENDALH